MTTSPNQVRSVRLPDNVWALADRLAARLQEETGLPAGRPDALRLGLVALAEKLGMVAEIESGKKSRKSSG